MNVWAQIDAAKARYEDNRRVVFARVLSALEAACTCGCSRKEHYVGCECRQTCPVLTTRWVDVAAWQTETGSWHAKARRGGSDCEWRGATPDELVAAVRAA